MTITWEYDGAVFIPDEPVNLPPGTRGTIDLPEPAAGVPSAAEDITDGARPMPPMTEEQRRDWDELVADLRATEPVWPTVEDAMRYTRGRP